MRRIPRFLFGLIALLLVVQRPLVVHAAYQCEYFWECYEWSEGGEGGVCIYGEWVEYCWWVPDPPPPPPPPPQLPDPDVEITAARIDDNVVEIALDGHGNSGRLQVFANYAGGSIVILDETRAAGLHTISYRRETFPEGQFNSLHASWDVQNNRHAEDTMGVAFRVLGAYRQTQYNTPDESACSGSPDAQREISESTNQCNVVIETGRNGNPGLKVIFSNEVEENGSGVSMSYGKLQKSWTCSNYSHFTKVSVINGSYGQVNNQTIAANASHPHLVAWDAVYTIGIGVKTVTDKCPGCSEYHVDNYTTNAGCRKHSFGDLPQEVSFRINR